MDVAVSSPVMSHNVIERETRPVRRSSCIGFLTFLFYVALEGTPGYVAPEILTAGYKVGYGNKVDVFSAGVTLYVMLCGYEPFYGENEKELIEVNKQAAIEFPDSDWSNGKLKVLKTYYPVSVASVSHGRCV